MGASLVLHGGPALAAESPSSTAAQTVDTRAVGGPLRGVLATPEEARKLAEAAAALPAFPSAPAGSDLSKLLAGDGPAPRAVSSPLQHGR